MVDHCYRNDDKNQWRRLIQASPDRRDKAGQDRKLCRHSPTKASRLTVRSAFERCRAFILCVIDLQLRSSINGHSRVDVALGARNRGQNRR